MALTVHVILITSIYKKDGNVSKLHLLKGFNDIFSKYLALIWQETFKHPLRCKIPEIN